MSISIRWVRATLSLVLALSSGAAFAQEMYRFEWGPHPAGAANPDACTSAAQPWYSTPEAACQGTKTVHPNCDRASAIYRNHVAILLPNKAECRLTWEFQNIGGGGWGSWSATPGVSVCSGDPRCAPSPPPPLRIALAGPTQAMPTSAGGQSLRLLAYVAPARPGVAVTVRMLPQAGGSISVLSAITDAAGQVLIDYFPPETLIGESKTDQIAADCQGCQNSANMSIQVQGIPLIDPGQACSGDAGLSTPNPILPASGIKVLIESDWQDAGIHPLSFGRNYASRWSTQPAAGLGTHWSHNHAHRVIGAGALAPAVRTVLFGDGSISRFINTAPVAHADSINGGTWQCAPNTWCEPPQPVVDPAAYPPQWSAQGSQDSMSDTAEGILVLRAADESQWLFDRITGHVLRHRQRNGWALEYGYANNRLSQITNAFGRQLQFAYDAQDRMVSVTTPDGRSIGFTFDAGMRLTSVQYGDSTSRSYLYEDGRWPQAVTGVLDEQGVRYGSFAYDTQGRAVSSELAGGVGRYSVAYGSGATAVTDPLGTTRSFQYQAMRGAASGLRTSQASAPAPTGNSTASQAFTTDGLLESQSDFLGVTTYFSWDHARRLKIEQTKAANRPEATTTQTQWHPSFRLPVLITETGRTTAYSYDSAGNKLSQTITDTATGDARTWQWTYNDKSLTETMTDPKGAVWRYGYDNAGNRISSKNPLGQQTLYGYDAAGRVTSQSQPNGLVTAYSYDARGRLIVLNRGGEISTYSYTPAGQLAGASLPNGLQVSYSYDGARRLIAAADNHGNSVSYTLDAMGNRTREEVKDATGAIALVTGRIIDSLNKVAAIQGSVGQTTALAYDANGEPIARTDPLNQTTRQTLDALRRATATTFPDNTSASQAWNQLGQLTQVTDPKGVQTSYQTNAFGEVMRESSPDIGSVAYSHDASGDVIAVQDAKGSTSAITRDALGRPTEIRYAPDHIAFFSYDQEQAGYLNKVEDKSGNTSYQRDAQGRVTTKTQSVNDNPRNPIQLKVSYGYQGGELASIGYPSGLKVFYKRTAGRITGIDVQEPATPSGKTSAVTAFVSDLTHTALGQPKSWTWKTGDSASRSFDTDGRMTSSEIASYSYDAAGRITAVTQRLWAQRTVTAAVGGKSQTVPELYQTPISWTIAYDARNRLTSLTRAGASTAYSYDANSNRLTAIEQSTSEAELEGVFDQPNFTQSSSQSLAIDSASNKLLGFSQTLTRTRAGGTVSSVVTRVNYSLDANGAMTSDGLRTFEYDESRRLAKVKVIKDGEAAAVEYLHNALGQRVFKSEPQVEQTLPNEEDLGPGFINWLRNSFGWLFTQGDGSKSSIGMAFIYDEHGLLLGEYDNGSAIGRGATEYIWLPTGAGRAIPIGLYRNGSVYAVHSDHLGTPRLITDINKKPVWQWPYSAFGNNKTTGAVAATSPANGQAALKVTKPAIEVNLRFPGQYFDEESNLSYNYLRTYQASQGRYTQPDPIGLAGGLSRFGYANQNAFTYIDSKGRTALPSALAYMFEGNLIEPVTDSSGYWEAGEFVFTTGGVGGSYANRWEYNAANQSSTPVPAPGPNLSPAPGSQICLTKDCSYIRAMCREECSETSLPSGDFGFRFFNCVNRCVARNGC